MSESDFPPRWTVRSSNSRFFPVHSTLELTPQKKTAGFKLAVTWEEEHATLRLLDKDFLPVAGKPDSLKGKFGRSKGKPDEENFELVVTLCPACLEDGKRRLFGLLVQTKGREPGSTGVWVAEQQQPPAEPPKE
jgi:hypothetical protein